MFTLTSEFISDLTCTPVAGLATLKDLTSSGNMILWRMEDSLVDINAEINRFKQKNGENTDFLVYLQGNSAKTTCLDLSAEKKPLLHGAVLRSPVHHPTYLALKALVDIKYPVRLFTSMDVLKFHPVVEALGGLVSSLEDALKGGHNLQVVSPYQLDYPDFLVPRSFNAGTSFDPEFILTL